MYSVRATLKKVICKKPHPLDSSRFLHFFSDFLHLVKNVWSRFLDTTFNTTGGLVPMQFVREAFKLDNNVVTMDTMPHITKMHVEPNNFESMRTSYAFELFGNGPLRAFSL